VWGFHQAYELSGERPEVRVVKTRYATIVWSRMIEERKWDLRLASCRVEIWAFKTLERTKLSRENEAGRSRRSASRTCVSEVEYGRDPRQEGGWGVLGGLSGGKEG